ncbi:MAG TPA: FtsX-like permease family protein [Cyclobacteriaceae bacterium]
MIGHFLQVSFRNLFLNKTYSVINITGLVLGISVSLMMLIHINQELNYESGFAKADRIYRVNYTTWAKSALPVAEAITSYFPAIEQTGRIGQWQYTDIMMHGEIHIPVGQGFLADQSILEIFEIQFAHGSVAESLTRPNTIILTETLANTIFPGENPVGKSVSLSGTGDIEVTGVMKDLAHNTHLKFEYLVSMPSLLTQLPPDRLENKGWMSCFTYVVLPEGHDIEAFETRLREFQYKFFEGDATPEEVDANGDFFELYPITSIHLSSHKEQELSQNSDVSYVYLFGAMAILIIIMASVNFINLFVTQLLKRSKEVGLRKVIGARKNEIVVQFMLEGFMVVAAAGLVSLAVCNALIPFYNAVAGLELDTAGLFSLNNLILFLGICMIIFLLASGLPSIFIAGLKPISALKGVKLPASSLLKLRKRLVVFQFAISIFMIIGVITVYRQMNFLSNKDLGFDKENVMSIRLYGKLWEEAVINRDALRTELLKSTLVRNVANIGAFLGNSLSVESLVPDGIDSVETQNLPSERFMRADEGFVPTMDMTLVAGRNFDPMIDPVNDSTSAFLINETTAKLLSLEEPVGMMASNGWTGSNGRIVGVIKDFNYASLHHEIEPIVIEYRPYWVGTMLVRLETGRTKAAAEYVQSTIQRVAPNSQVLYTFLDDNLAQMYLDETNIKKVLVWFSGLAILIAGLGLFALSAYVTEVRTKEVGIRKVLGSTAPQIVLLFTREYFVMIAIAFVLAAPAAYYVIRLWLSDFAYQIGIAWWMFAISGLVVLLIALLAVSTQSLRAAFANPTKSLRSE